MTKLGLFHLQKGQNMSKLDSKIFFSNCEEPLAAQVIDYPGRNRRPQSSVKPIPKKSRAQPESWGPPIVVNTLLGWRFQWHEEVLKRWDLSRGAIAVAGVLMHQYRVQRGCAELSISLIALAAGCARGTVVAALKKLRNAGLIAVLNEGVRRPGSKAVEAHKYELIYTSRNIVARGGRE